MNFKLYINLVLLLTLFAYHSDAQSFITTWNTANPGVSASTAITIPTGAGVFDYDVDWDNDGVFDDFNINGPATYDFGVEGIYTVRIQGDFPNINFNNGGDKDKIIDIVEWGDIEWVSFENAFKGCSNLNSSASDAPDLSNVGNMSFAFQLAVQFNGDVSNWDMSFVKNMRGMFWGATSFDRDISNWNTAMVTDMAFMFFTADSFNGDLSSWNVEKVTLMASMFSGADTFNGDISTWNPIKTTDMSFMFSDAQSFDQDLGSWNIPMVLDMTNMLSNTVMSIENYDNSLIGWANQVVQDDVILGASGLEYCGGEGARINLMNNYNWTINGDIKNCPYFVIQFDTSLPGSSNATSAMIPSIGGDYAIDWENDGIFDDFNLSGSTTHDFGVSGIYTIMIKGDLPRIYFNNSGDKDKITSIIQWGDNPWTTMNGAFHGCNNLIINAADNPDLSNLTDMSSMFESASNFAGSLNGWDVSNITNMSNLFKDATNFNSTISGWDVSSVEDMSGMMMNATSFNQSIGGWNIGAVNDMTDMLSDCGMSTENYDNTLIGWSAQNYQSNVTLGAQNLNYCVGEAARNSLINLSNWTIIGDSKACPFVTSWKTDNPGDSNPSSITIPTFPGETYSYDVDWDNDGNYDDFGVAGDITHDYGVPGIYEVAIRGQFPRIYFNNEGDKEKILDIIEWGGIQWSNMKLAFYGCYNMDVSAIDAPDLSNLTNLHGMFSNTKISSPDLTSWDVSTVTDMSSLFINSDDFNGDISNWDVSNVTDMSRMFQSATTFNQSLGNWNVSNVNDMAQMFRWTNDFNQDLSTWDVSNVSSMSGMFAHTEDFNGPINNWNVSAVTDMSAMFAYALAFNQDINSWDVSNVINMTSMFAATDIFNKDISSWDVTNVVNMTSMFSSAQAFNQDLGQWDVSGVNLMNSMFHNTPIFNGNIGTWDVSNVTKMSFMFALTEVFNQDLNNWNTSNVTVMSSMFLEAATFNGDISNWDVSNATVLTSMFVSAGNFDQDLSAWDISNASNMVFMFSLSGLSLGNYDKILIAWADLDVQANAGLGVLGLTYCKGEQARQSLIDNHGWGFVGDEKECSFITTWKTNNPGISPDDAITIPTIGGGYNYDVDWNNDGVFDQFGINGSVSYIYPQPGTYTIRIQGDFPRIYFNNSGDKEKIINIDQWGDNEWTSMENAFFGCYNLNASTSDSPDLSNVTNMSGMLKTALVFNGDVSDWDVSNVTNMSELFAYAELFEGDVSGWDVSNVTNMSNFFWVVDNFNSDVSGWDVSNVTDMGGMFGGNEIFDADLSGWDVSSVTNMKQMFSGAESFNSDLSGWDVSNVTNMRSMFKGTEVFNSDISDWDVSNVTLMYHMFWGADIFNIDISGWDVSNVTNMVSMFRGALAFNQDISTWNTANVTDISAIFSYTDNFNHDLSNWDMSNVDDMSYAFQFAEAFNQDLGDWDISSVTDMEEMLSSSGLSEENYDQTLIGWANQNVNLNVVLDANELDYCAGKAARDFLTGTKGWIISGDNNNCPPFITTWKTDNPGTSPNDAISIPTTGGGYNYDVDWNNDGVFDQMGIIGSVSHIFPQPGTYTIRIRGDFPRIFFDNGGDKEKLINIDQWGENEWSSMENAFKGCENMTMTATDAPDLSNVTNLSGMFYKAKLFNGDLSSWDVSNATDMSYMFWIADLFNGDVSTWDVSNVTNMKRMFWGNSLFNSDISDWDVSNVTDMSDMFKACFGFNSDVSGWDVSNVTDMSGMFYTNTSFNGELSNWDVSSVTDMYEMFRGAIIFNSDIGGWDVSGAINLSSMFRTATIFNQDIGAWDVSNVENMSLMFLAAEAFNQDIGNWNVASVTNMQTMFGHAYAFDQNIGDWNVASVSNLTYTFLNATAFDWDLGGWDVTGATDMTDMLDDSGLSQENYDQTLIGWSGHAVNLNVELGAEGLNYCVGESARNTLVNNFGWIITGDTKSCLPAFVTTWKTDNPGTSNASSITIPAAGPGLKYHVDWDNDGVYDDINVNGAITHDYGAAGTYTVAISGIFPRIAFNNSGDKEKLLYINQWSDNAWSSMQNAFYGCTNLQITALDIPNLSNVESTVSMFRGASALNSGMNGWNLSNVTTTTFMFADAISFNQNLNTWDVCNVENMSYMFYNAAAFDGNISNWDVDNVSNMYGLFWNAIAFNQNIGNWNTTNVSDMRKVFESATAFNQDLGNWNIANVDQMNSMLKFSGLSLDNYDNTLLGWANQNVKPNVSLGADGLEYCASQVQRTFLINNKGWIITGDILGCAPCGVITWIGGLDNWMKANLWDLGRLPLPCDEVKINIGGHVILNNGELSTIQRVTNEGVLELKTGSKLEILTN